MSQRHTVKLIRERMFYAGMPGAPGLNLAADILEILREETYEWVNRCDDAVRIPDVIDEMARSLRKEAKSAPPAKEEAIRLECWSH